MNVSLPLSRWNQPARNNVSSNYQLKPAAKESILVTLMMEEIRSSATSVFTRTTRHRIREDGILHALWSEDTCPRYNTIYNHCGNPGVGFPIYFISITCANHFGFANPDYGFIWTIYPATLKLSMVLYEVPTLVQANSRYLMVVFVQNRRKCKQAATRKCVYPKSCEHEREVPQSPTAN
jgi:hypothetical protein